MSVSVTVPAPQVAGEALLTRPDGAPGPVITASAASEHPVTPDEKRLLQALVWTLKPLINLRGSIPLPFVTTFLMVALDEGKSVGTYARAIGVHRFAMSRYLRAIGDHARNGGPGLGLVTIEVYPADPRRRQVFLTDRGRAVIGEVFEQMRETAAGRIEKHNPTFLRSFRCCGKRSGEAIKRFAAAPDGFAPARNDDRIRHRHSAMTTDLTSV